jgi:hypothetical protein
MYEPEIFRHFTAFNERGSAVSLYSERRRETMEPGWFVLLVFMLVEVLLVLLLVMPMPNNAVRGAVVNLVSSLWDQSGLRYTFYIFLAADVFYFWYVCDALLHPLYDFGLIMPFEVVSCEIKAGMYQAERNAYITGFSLFLFLILHRLIDIQKRLHMSREAAKSAGAPVPMGQPVDPGGKFHYQ